MNLPETLKLECHRRSRLNHGHRTQKVSRDVIGGKNSRIQASAELIGRDGRVIGYPRESIVQRVDKCENHRRPVVDGAIGADMQADNTPGTLKIG